MSGAGRLNYRLQFQARAEPVNDGYGNTVAGNWEPQFDAHCGITFLKGSETVIASRLESKAPIIIAIRNSSNARRVTAEWRAKDIRTGTIYQIKEPPRPTDDRSMLEMLALSGVGA